MKKYTVCPGASIHLGKLLMLFFCFSAIDSCQQIAFHQQLFNVFFFM